MNPSPLELNVTRLSISLVALIALGLVLSGCTKKEEPAPKPAAHAAAATPGSHEDWCSEHGVPESLCTRCNAQLIPAFKATNDWCEEHGLPESQCKICNPGLKIERPPKKGEGK